MSEPSFLWLVFGKLWTLIKAHPIIFLVVFAVLILLFVVFAKNMGDRTEGRYQVWVLWGGIMLVVAVVTFVLLKLLENSHLIM